MNYPVIPALFTVLCHVLHSPSVLAPTLDTQPLECYMNLALWIHFLPISSPLECSKCVPLHYMLSNLLQH